MHGFSATVPAAHILLSQKIPMALVQCRECGKEISSAASACPHCGFPLQDGGKDSPPSAVRTKVSTTGAANLGSGLLPPRKRANKGCLWLVGVVTLAFVLVVAFSGSPSTSPSVLSGDEKSKLQGKSEAEATEFGQTHARWLFERAIVVSSEYATPGSLMNQVRAKNGARPLLSRSDVERFQRSIMTEILADVMSEVRITESRAGVPNTVIDAYFRGFADECQRIKQGDDRERDRSESPAPPRADERASPSTTTDAPTQAGARAPTPFAPPPIPAKVETSNRGDVIVQRRPVDDGYEREVWLLARDGQSPPCFLLRHDWRSGNVSFSPDDNRLIVEEGGGAGSSLGTEFRIFRRQTGNAYKEEDQLELLSQAMLIAVRKHGLPANFNPDHIYGVIKGWSQDSSTVRLSVWGHGANGNGDGHVPETEVDILLQDGRGAATGKMPAPSNTAQRYVNEKHGFSIILPPQSFSPPVSSSSQDSATAYSADGKSKLLLLVKPKKPGQSLAQLYSEWSAEHTRNDPGKTVDYKVLRDTWFVVSGGDGPRGYYVKVAARGDKFYFCCLEYDNVAPPLGSEGFATVSRSFPGF